MTDSATAAQDGTETAGTEPGGERPARVHISQAEQEALAQPAACSRSSAARPPIRCGTRGTGGSRG